jgi:glutathione S-transferase
MVLEEKKMDYQLIEEDLDHFSDALLALHPEGRVPLLVHAVGEKKWVIFQSTIITEYLDEVFPQVPLMPTCPVERAQVRLWTYWCDQLFKYERPNLSEGQSQELQMRLHQHLKKWDDGLIPGPYLLGEQMTMADIHLFPFARQFLAIQPQWDGARQYLRLQVWLNQMVSRPAFDRVKKDTKSL